MYPTSYITTQNFVIVNLVKKMIRIVKKSQLNKYIQQIRLQRNEFIFTLKWGCKVFSGVIYNKNRKVMLRGRFFMFNSLENSRILAKFIANMTH